MHIQLDAVGGVSGNMFVGAILDTYPQWAGDLSQQISLAGFSDLVTLQSEAHNDGVLSGTFFQVQASGAERAASHDHQHNHRPYALIRETLESSQLHADVKQHALGIFKVLAQAEAQVHGKNIDEVSFHEVGAWDSIADVVCSAFLIHRLEQVDGHCSWSVSALPLGNGTINSAHGMLPVPAPAVALLLKDFTFYQDDIDGERVTPTGAAILKHLLPSGSNVQERLLNLSNTGFGFGSKQFPGISNVLRLLAFSSDGGENAPWQEETVLQIQFEVDDQNSEDLAEALTQIRLVDGVLDVSQFPVFGKKGRIATCVQILSDVNKEKTVVAACFNQSNTIGLRKQIVQRAVLPREEKIIRHQNNDFSVKTVIRPNGQKTQKVSMGDVARVASSHAERQSLRVAIEEQLAKEGCKKND